MQILILVLILEVNPHQCNSFKDRSKRQIPKTVKQGCETTGYEKRIRELCEEVLEKICKPTKEVEYRKEIQTRCDTRIQQRCNTTTRERPREVCKERSRTQCFQDYRVVEETSYDQECENIVQHVCEEHYKVPVPVSVPVPIPTPHPHTFPISQVPAKIREHPDVIRSLPRVPRQKRMRKKRFPQVIDHRKLVFELKNALKAPHPPIVHHKELPAPPGCRSLVTQKCHKIPVKINRRIPKESCMLVPDIVCHLELESYEEPVCENVPVEECEDVYKEIPFLVDDEQCEDVPKLECTEVEEEVPIQVCTNIDINRDVIISNYGRTYSTDTKKSGAEIVGRIPTKDEDDEEEERSGRGRKLDNLRSKVFGSRDNNNNNSRKRVARLLKKLLSENHNR